MKKYNILLLDNECIEILIENLKSMNAIMEIDFLVPTSNLSIVCDEKEIVHILKIMNNITT